MGRRQRDPAGARAGLLDSIDLHMALIVFGADIRSSTT